MNAKASNTAQKLLNLYRQQHVIVGGWAAVNPVFVAEAADDVIAALMELPTGKMLVQHIKNLRSGKTKMNTIDRDLLPYGGMMAENIVTRPLRTQDRQELAAALERFTPDQAGLDLIMGLDVVKKYGDEWMPGIRAALADDAALAGKWNIVIQTWRAYNLWDSANLLLTQPLSDRARAQLQADMPEYETYLPMFGDAGNELLGKLRTFISSKKASAD